MNNLTPNQLRDHLLNSNPDIGGAKKLAQAMTDERKMDTETYLRCPRCYGYHSIHHNFDNLCDACVTTILTHFPDHESVPHIKAALNKWKLNDNYTLRQL